MLASKLRAGLSIDGQRITNIVTVVRNCAPFVRVTLADKSERYFRTTADVALSGYVEKLAAGRPAAAERGQLRKVRVSDGRWAGEAGGFRIDFIARTPMYDLTKL